MAVLGSSSPIKSIQRGTTQAFGAVNVTITAVDLSKSFVSSSFLSGYYSASTAGNGISGGTTLSSSTNLQVIRGGSVAFTASPTVYWEVIEYV